jgi:hypothetical protein
MLASLSPRWTSVTLRRAKEFAMTRTMIASALGAALLAACAVIPPSAADEIWVPRDQAVAQLEDAKGVARRGLGLAEGGEAVLELFVAPSGEWCLLVTRADGLSRLAGSGEAWIAQDGPPAGDPI